MQVSHSTLSVVYKKKKKKNDTRFTRTDSIATQIDEGHAMCRTRGYPVCDKISDQHKNKGTTPFQPTTDMPHIIPNAAYQNGHA